MIMNYTRTYGSAFSTYHSRICLEGIRKAIKCQDGQYLGNSNFSNWRGFHSYTTMFIQLHLHPEKAKFPVQCNYCWI